MKTLLVIWARAFAIVSLTALNVTQVSAGRYLAAFATGGTLSFVWWMNTRIASHASGRAAHFTYAFGAACGTMFGMWVGRMLRG